MADMQERATLSYISPLEAASALVGVNEPCALLYSGLQMPHSGRFSYLAWDLADTIEGERWQPLADSLSNDQPWHSNAWFGYCAYELKDRLEQLPDVPPAPINIPHLHFMQFNKLLRFDHITGTLTYFSTTEDTLSWPPAHVARSTALPEVANIHSNMDRARYIQSVKDTLEQIKAGNFYQANITRKFFGTLEAPPDSLALFSALCAISPSPYSSFLRLPDGKAILSSSPECFVHIDQKRHIITRPIKGSAPADSDKNTLAHSQKDKAENLMIVDLMRNDLSRVCETGSVKTDSLHTIESYSTIHHMVSTISGVLREDATALDAVKACFPPGSMTGAPKIRAMQWCSEQEQIARGVYSGALGWFGGDGSADLSVVIRTLLLDENRFEFQVGGGIVADSEPEKEWQETLVKARGIGKALQLDEDQLAAL